MRAHELLPAWTQAHWQARPIRWTGNIPQQLLGFDRSDAQTAWTPYPTAIM